MIKSKLPNVDKETLNNRLCMSILNKYIEGLVFLKSNLNCIYNVFYKNVVIAEYDVSNHRVLFRTSEYTSTGVEDIGDHIACVSTENIILGPHEFIGGIILFFKQYITDY